MLRYSHLDLMEPTSVKFESKCKVFFQENAFVYVSPFVQRPVLHVINLLSAASVYIQDHNVVITVSADGLALDSAGPSVGTVFTEQLDMFSFTFCL